MRPLRLSQLQRAAPRGPCRLCCMQRQLSARKLSELELTMKRIELQQQGIQPVRTVMETPLAGPQSVPVEPPAIPQPTDHQPASSSSLPAGLQTHQLGSHRFITVNEHTDVAAAAALAALALRDRQQLTLLVSGKEACAAAMAVLQQSRRLLQPYDKDLVLQPMCSDKPNALRNADIFLNIHYVDRLSLKQEVFARASKATNPDALSEVIMAKLRGDLPHCIVEAAGDDAIANSLRAIIIARKRMLKTRSDLAVMVAETVATDPKHSFIKFTVQQMICLKCRVEEPYKLAQYRLATDDVSKQ